MAKHYPLAMLIDIRNRRYGSLLQNQRQYKDKLLQLSNILALKKKELEDYKVWKKKEVNRRYDQIMGVSKTLKEMADFNQEIADLDYEELEKKLAIEEIKGEISKCKAQLEKINIEVANALKSLEKIKKHQELWFVEQKKINDFRADLELEDFKVKKQNYF